MIRRLRDNCDVEWGRIERPSRAEARLQVHFEPYQPASGIDKAMVRREEEQERESYLGQAATEELCPLPALEAALMATGEQIT
jgi:hypothetical protein